MTANVIRTVLLDILLPIAAYFGLVSCGLAPAWALAASAGIAVVALGARWFRSRELSTLGLLVLVRFVLGVVVALLTGDARFVLVKDYLVTFVIALAALGTLRLGRPFIARIRRDLSPDPARFDEQWDRDPGFRRTHRRLTGLWVVGLVGEVVVAVVVIYTTPLAVAVVVTGVLTPAVLLTLTAVTQYVPGGHRERPPVLPTCHNVDYRFIRFKAAGPKWTTLRSEARSVGISHPSVRYLPP
jgi:intracellular septation protein A